MPHKWKNHIFAILNKKKHLKTVSILLTVEYKQIIRPSKVKNNYIIRTTPRLLWKPKQRIEPIDDLTPQINENYDVAEYISLFSPLKIFMILYHK